MGLSSMSDVSPYLRWSRPIPHIVPGLKKKTFVTWKPPWMTSHAVVPKTSTKKSFLVIFDDFSTLSIPRLVDTLKWISNMEKVHPSSRRHKVRHSVGTPLFLWSYTFQKQSLHKRTRHTTQVKRVVGMYEPSCIFYIMTRHSHTWFLIFFLPGYIHTILVFFKIVPSRVIVWIVDQNYLQNADNADSVHTPGYEPLSLSPEGRR